MSRNTKQADGSKEHIEDMQRLMEARNEITHLRSVLQENNVIVLTDDELRTNNEIVKLVLSDAASREELLDILAQYASGESHARAEELMDEG